MASSKVTAGHILLFRRIFLVIGFSHPFHPQTFVMRLDLGVRRGGAGCRRGWLLIMKGPRHLVTCLNKGVFEIGLEFKSFEVLLFSGTVQHDKRANSAIPEVGFMLYIDVQAIYWIQYIPSFSPTETQRCFRTLNRIKLLSIYLKRIDAMLFSVRYSSQHLFCKPHHSRCGCILA